MADSRPQAGEVYKVREGFAVPGDGGFMRTYTAGSLIDGGDPVATSHRALLEPASNSVEQATAAPGERRSLGGLRLPSGRLLGDVTAHRTGHAHETGARSVRTPTNIDPVEGGPDMVHALPANHPDSPASVHAPLQPGLGVVSDDADERGQNLAGGVKSSESDAEVKKVAARRGKVAKQGEGSGEVGTPVAQAGDAAPEDALTPEPDKADPKAGKK